MPLDGHEWRSNFLNAMRDKMWIFTAIISVFYAVGFGLLGYALYSWKRSTDAANWPTAVGTIQSCELRSHSDGEGTTHQVQVRYRYEAEGREWTNDVLAFGYSGSSGRQSHLQIVDRLQSAETVQVRYRPNDPQTSVLSFGFHRSIKLMLTFAIFWLTFVIGFTILFWIGASDDGVLLENLVTQ